MVIPFPERISYAWATLFACVLLAVQLYQHTHVIFALCCFAFILVAVAGVNFAGGVTRPAGAYIFCNATLTLIIGLVAKASLGEAADTNLAAPTRSIQVYLLGMVAMLAAALVEHRFRRRRSVLETFFPLGNLRTTYIGAAVLGVVSYFFFFLPASISGSSAAATFRNLNQFLPFALILGVLYTVRASNGRRSLTPGLGLLYAFAFVIALPGYSKQGIFTPALCWVAGACLARYQLKPINLVSLALMVYVLAAYLTPYSQYGRDLPPTGSYIASMEQSFSLLANISTVKALESKTESEEYGRLNYFNHSEGLLDRLQMFSPDDALIDVTDRMGTFGYEPTKEGWENLIPHVLWPGKPTPYFGNMYAHQIGGIDDEDVTTGVSFGISADAYHQGGLIGVLVVETLCLTAVFLVLSWLLGDVRDHPAVIISILVIAHLAPEGAIPGLILLIQNAVTILILGFICMYVLPVFASILEPPDPAGVPSRHILTAN